ncbi:hypothetical protein [Vibrio parahaemolyticus]|uniref:hypothetical protein n=1 Tax=Vibrio parahaemolyticus TaxID=670 RepID=UPI000C278EF9|nr:hypothetical protein [Vibrio parahaemolyticus]MDF5052690.1 hypothetical protein [Vibrio parahaemolyticus]PJN44106.1 hypothetical protein CNR26_20235 [Vibrio parahaemolyticus]
MIEKKFRTISVNEIDRKLLERLIISKNKVQNNAVCSIWFLELIGISNYFIYKYCQIFKVDKRYNAYERHRYDLNAVLNYYEEHFKRTFSFTVKETNCQYHITIEKKETP